MKALQGLHKPCHGCWQASGANDLRFVLLARHSKDGPQVGALQARGSRSSKQVRLNTAKCRAAALQFDTKVFEAEKVDFAGHEE